MPITSHRLRLMISLVVSYVMVLIVIDHLFL
jgi:hypothetical protein